MPRTQSASSSRLTIADRATLAREVKSAIDDGFGGNTSRAAAAVGLAHSQLFKICAAKLGQLGPATMPKLLKLMQTDEARERVMFAVLSSTAVQLLGYYERWCEARVSGQYPRGAR